jgi:3-dehydroquinate synthase
MTKIIVHTKGLLSSCPVLVGADAGEAAKIAAGICASGAAIINCRNSEKISNKIESETKAIGLESITVQIADGEKNKTIENAIGTVKALVDSRLDRDAVVIAVGGGTVGDIAAFAASIYLRGIRVIHVPTTLLAMADSAIGGKTGVDLGGKNVIGTFHQPSAVVVDLSALDTLPPEQLRQGVSEILKCGVIGDRNLFGFLEKNPGKILEKDADTIKEAVVKAIEVKARLVAVDERESRAVNPGNSRKLLNFGHTVGHAVETASGFSVLHGDAVSIGMAAETAIAQELGLLDDKEAFAIRDLQESLRLPLTANLDLRAVLDAMKLDKKRAGAKIVMALPAGIGAGMVVEDVSAGLVEKCVMDVLGK